MTTLLIQSTARQVFDRRLRTVLNAGAKLPDNIAELRQRINTLDRNGHPCRDKVVAAIADNDESVDTATLWALAIAEAAPAAQVAEEVREALHQRLRDVYAWHAANGVYDQLADKFNQAADKLTQCAAAVDPDMPAEQAARANEKPRRAWVDAETHATQLTELMPALHAAAKLCGVAAEATAPDGTVYRASDTRGTPSDDELLLPLCVDTAGCAPAAVWAAWSIDFTARELAAKQSEGFTVTVPVVTRTGRWGALLRAGARLRASKLDYYEPYPRPIPGEAGAA